MADGEERNLSGPWRQKKVDRQEQVIEDFTAWKQTGPRKRWPSKKALKGENQTIIMPKISAFRLLGIIQNSCIEQ